MRSIYRASPSMLVEGAKRELDRRLFSGDPVELAKAGKIYPDPWQEKLLLSQSKRIILNCSRQAGKTTTASLKCLHLAMFKPESLILILAPGERQSKEFFRKLLDVYHALGEVIPANSEQRLTLELTNGSRLIALPGTEKTVRGFSAVEMIVIDEAARIEDTLYTSVRPMLAVSGGAMMLLSTPFGKRGVFYNEWKEGRNWERYRIPATLCPRLTPEFLEEEMATMPPHEFEQEYMCEFVDTEDQVFPSDLIDAALDNDYEPLFPSLASFG